MTTNDMKAEPTVSVSCSPSASASYEPELKKPLRRETYRVIREVMGQPPTVYRVGEKLRPTGYSRRDGFWVEKGEIIIVTGHGTEDRLVIGKDVVLVEEEPIPLSPLQQAFDDLLHNLDPLNPHENQLALKYQHLLSEHLSEAKESQ